MDLQAELIKYKFMRKICTQEVVRFLGELGYQQHMNDNCFSYFFNINSNHLVRLPISEHFYSRDEVVRLFIGKKFDFKPIDKSREYLVDLIMAA